MFKRILVAVDRSTLSTDVARAASQLARCCKTEAVALLHVMSGIAPVIADPNRSAQRTSGKERDAKRYLGQLHGEFPAGTAVEDIVVEGPIEREIISTALAWQPDLVVVGDHDRRGLAALVMGDIADDIARRAPCAVLVVRAGDVPGPSVASSSRKRTQAAAAHT